MLGRFWPHHFSGHLVEIKALRPGNRPDGKGPPRFQSITLCVTSCPERDAGKRGLGR